MRLALLLLVTGLIGLPAQAATITVDENGHGTSAFNGTVTALPGGFAPDPGPGGLPNVFTYFLPFTTVTGDVLLLDADAGGAFLDVIRFNGNTLAFYSDNVDGADALADTPSPPAAFYTNIIRIPEVGPEGNNGAFYAPLQGQPGYAVDAAGTVTYQFISDGTAVPLPASVWSGLALFAGLAICKLRRS